MKIRIENIIVTAVIQALLEAGEPVTEIIDLSEGWREKVRPGTSVSDIAKEALGLEYARLVTKSGKWINVIDGNEEYVFSDYHIELSDIIEPVIELFQD